VVDFWASGMEAFEYSALPARVVFGVGTLPRVADEMNGLGLTRAFVLSDPHHAGGGAARLMRALDKLGVQLSTDAVMHTPADVTERVMKKLVACNADCLVSLGGGSTIGLGKALALRTDLPQIVLPTTYAGSEATPILGETDGGKKTTIRTMKVLPEVIVYDVELTYGLPPGLSLVSGINAIAHAVAACTRGKPTRLFPISRNRASPRSDARCPGLFRTLPTAMPGPTPCSGHGPADRASARSGCRCTTSYATFLAGPSACRTRKPTR
jgi:alcohol dehydrogenase class IV